MNKVILPLPVVTGHGPPVPLHDGPITPYPELFTDSDHRDIPATLVTVALETPGTNGFGYGFTMGEFCANTVDAHAAKINRILFIIRNWPH